MKMEIQEKNSGTSMGQVRQWFFSEVGFLIMFGGIIVGAVMFVINPLNKIEKDIAVMQNDVMAIKDAVSDHATFSVDRVKEVDAKLAEEDKQISLIKQFLKLK